MDIAITLPKHLWQLILAGKKTIELRKNFPTYFLTRTHKVFVCEKGSNKVLGYFYIKRFECISTKTLLTSPERLKQIAVPAQWVETYVGNSEFLYLWHINGAVSFEPPKDRNSFLFLFKNPQSFVYLH